jgi:hypothetical protein
MINSLELSCALLVHAGDEEEIARATRTLSKVREEINA